MGDHAGKRRYDNDRGNELWLSIARIVRGGDLGMYQ
jgi:hypothetical protein